jgi:hypothetical protein
MVFHFYFKYTIKKQKTSPDIQKVIDTGYLFKGRIPVIGRYPKSQDYPAGYSMHP